MTSKIDLLRWLDEAPGRRLTFRDGSVVKVELGGELQFGPDLRDLADELGKAHLLAPAGMGWWKISPAGMRLVNEDPPPSKPKLKPKPQRPKKPHRVPGKPPNERRCAYVYERGKREGRQCEGWNQAGSPYCAHHPPHVRWRKRPVGTPAEPAPSGSGLELPVLSPAAPALPEVDLHRLPELPAVPKTGRKCHHGLTFCPQCEEAEQLDALAHKRLRAAADKAAAERAAYDEGEPFNW